MVNITIRIEIPSMYTKGNLAFCESVPELSVTGCLK